MKIPDVVRDALGGPTGLGVLHSPTMRAQAEVVMDWLKGMPRTIALNAAVITALTDERTRLIVEIEKTDCRGWPTPPNGHREDMLGAVDALTARIAALGGTVDAWDTVRLVKPATETPLT